MRRVAQIENRQYRRGFERCSTNAIMKRKTYFTGFAGRIATVLICTSAAAAQENNQTIPDPVPLLLKAPNGLVNVGALDLPPSFLQHLADWEIRNSFRDAFRRVAPDPIVKASDASAPPVGPMDAGPSTEPDVM